MGNYGITLRCCEIVSYIFKPDGSCYWTIETILSIIQQKPCIERYSCIVHDKDVYTKEDEEKNPLHKEGTQKPPHIHLLLYFQQNNPQKSHFVAKWFSLPENLVSRIKGKW